MKRILLLIVCSLLVAVSSALGQFQGEISFQLEQFGPSQPETIEFKLTASGDRLYLDSQVNINIITGLQSDGLLVRNDMQDFVFNTGQNEALKVAKSDLDGLMNMIERFSGASGSSTSSSNWQNRIVETENRREILGYEVQEIRLLGETTDQYVSVWLTDEIKVMWGMMTSVWNSAGKRFLDPDFPIELVMNSNSFPLQVDVIDNGRLAASFKSTGIETENFDRSVVELSDQKRLVSITEVMMNMFR